jgi:hypothetical protein
MRADEASSVRLPRDSEVVSAIPPQVLPWRGSIRPVARTVPL